MSCHVMSRHVVSCSVLEIYFFVTLFYVVSCAVYVVEVCVCVCACVSIP